MIYNLTPHSIDIYPESAFENLEQLNPTTWVADSVSSEDFIRTFESVGSLRISTKTEDYGMLEGIPIMQTTHGSLEGLPETFKKDDYAIVSLPAQAAAKAANNPFANKFLVPYKVVRLRSNTSVVLGCMGLSF